MKQINFPNLLTLLRIGASFVYLFFGLVHRWDVAFPIFCLAAFTDMVDGTIARLLGQRTRLGAFLDPMADKLLMFFSFLTLTLSHKLPLFLTCLVIARDLLIIIGLVVLHKKKIPIVYRPTYLSKATTFFQILTVFSALLLTQNLEAYRTTMAGSIFFGGFPITVTLTALLTLMTGIQYWQIGMERIQHATPQTDRQ